MFRLALIALLGLGCEDTDPGDLVTCGAGTTLIEGECRPDGTPVVCAKGTTLTNGQCVPSAEACGAGTVLDATGVCIAEGAIACGPGTMLSVDECVPDPTQICRVGTTYDPAMGGCVASLSCRTGEVLVGDVCLTAEELAASMADVIEGVPDANDPAFGGTPESLPTPNTGEVTIFTGMIEEPADLDGDFDLDQDWDYWSFTASSGDTFEIVLNSLGSSELGFVITGPNGYRRLSPLYFVPEPSRHVVLPYDGTYTIAIAPQLAIERAIDGGPSGGEEHLYVVALEREAFPLPDDLTLGPTISGNFADLTNNLYLVRAPAGSLVRVELQSAGRDVTPILLTFNGIGTFTSERPDLPSGVLVHRMGEADDLMLLMDWVRLVGEEESYSIRAVEIQPNDTGAIPPDTTVVSSTISIPAGESGYFVATVSAGQIVELILGGPVAPDARVLGPDGAVVNQVSNSRTARFYAAIGGQYTVEVRNGGTGAGAFGVVFTSITPVTAGPLDPNVNTGTVAYWLPDVPSLENAYFVVSTSEPVQLDIAAMQASVANLSLAIFDPRFNALRQLPLGGTEPALSAFLPVPGDTIVEVLNSDPNVALSGLSIDVAVLDLPPIELEPNDDPTQATPLVLDEPLFGEIEAGDNDFFRITLLVPLAATQVLEVRAAESDATDDYTCQLRDSTGAIMEEQTPRRLGCVIFASGLDAGDYYFSIQKAEPARRVYQIVASIIPGTRESEPNDEAPGDLIADLTGTLPVYGEVALNTDADVFTFMLPADLAATELLIVRAELVGTNPTGTIQAAWTGTNVSSTFAVAPVGTSIRYGVTAGDYRIRMSRTSANAVFDGHYRIAVSTSSVSVVDTEPNNTILQPQPLGPLPGTAIGLLTAPTTGDDDFYSFVLAQDLASDETLSIQLYRIGEQPTDSLRVSLFDGNTTFVTSSATGDPRLITQLGRTAGTYYVRVDSTFNTTIDTDYLVVVSVD